MTDAGNEGKQPRAAATFAVAACRHFRGIEPDTIGTEAVTVVGDARVQPLPEGIEAETEAVTVVGGRPLQPGVD